MLFLAPIWFLGLLPWAAVGVWLMTGARRREGVPFLPLWGAEVGNRKATPHFHRPPLPVALAMAAALLGILGAAKPASIAKSPAVVVIVDRGVTMSALDGERPRFVAASERLFKAIPPSSDVELIDALSGAHTRNAWLQTITSAPRTAIDSRSAVAQALRDQSKDLRPVFVLTDAPVPNRVAPPRPFDDVQIAALVVRDGLPRQAMVTIRNPSAARTVRLKVSIGERVVEQPVDLPALGDANVFVDLPGTGDRVEASIGDARAFSLRKGSASRVEIRSTVSDPLRRFAKIYERQQSDRSADSALLVLAASEDDLHDEIGAIEAPAMNPSAGAVSVVEDPLTAVVDWQRMVRNARLADAPRGAGWQALVSVGGKAVIARRESPARQVWVGLDAIHGSRDPDYVVFWANAFNWLGTAQPAWGSEPVRMLSTEWTAEQPPPPGVDRRAWPGIYRTADGREVALNAPAIDPALLASGGLDPVLSPGVRTHRSWAWAFALATLIALVAAAVCWPSHASALSPVLRKGGRGEGFFGSPDRLKARQAL